MNVVVNTWKFMDDHGWVEITIAWEHKLNERAVRRATEPNPTSVDFWEGNKVCLLDAIRVEL